VGKPSSYLDKRRRISRSIYTINCMSLAFIAYVLEHNVDYQSKTYSWMDRWTEPNYIAALFKESTKYVCSRGIDSASARKYIFI